MIKNLSGMKFGKLTALHPIKTGNSVKWECQCECGGKIVIFGYDLQRGRVVSCGCRKVKHGGRYTRLYTIWQSMIKRCENQNHKFYRYYGGKGISVCCEWRDDFEQFKTWAVSSGYKDNLTIDRINSAENYCPKNCQWISASENTRKADYERWHKRSLMKI